MNTTLLDPETGEPIIQTNILDDDSHSDAPHSDAPSNSRPQLQSGRAGDNVLDALRRIKRDAPNAIKQLLDRRGEHVDAITELDEHLAMLGHQVEPAEQPKTRKPRGPNKPKPNGAASDSTAAAAVTAAVPAAPKKKRGRPALAAKDAIAPGLAPPKRGWPAGKKRGPRKPKP